MKLHKYWKLYKTKNHREFVLWLQNKRGAWYIIPTIEFRNEFHSMYSIDIKWLTLRLILISSITYTIEEFKEKIRNGNKNQQKQNLTNN